MLDEFKGAYRGIASSLHSHLLRHLLQAVAAVLIAIKTCSYQSFSSIFSDHHSTQACVLVGRLFYHACGLYVILST